jgi:hypothetical protein
MDSNQFNSGFWLTLVGLLVSAIGASGFYCLKSKCVKCTVCYGLIVLERNVTAENEAENMEIEAGIPQPSLNRL